MNLASYLANKCFEYLLNTSPEKKESGQEGSVQSPAEDFSVHTHAFFPPPWIRNIPAFRSGCDRCGACIENCENNVLVRDKDGYPQIDFSRGSCSFCGKCAESCSRDIFKYGPSIRPWELRASINDNCLAKNNVLCGTCTEHCEEEAIVVPKSNGPVSPPLILEEKCRGCGACYSSCPVGAITMTDGRESGKS